ncbi:hypothetical protein N1851_033224 [Merluccius polli]|uniref:Uncharacterized protein n=1 Tax=Merluccius polli TaxID=89951 RepID=A0AA47M1M7_MERPO|nr:hypothetical protein N1851_033224 [Merluccius polli]
MHQIDGGLRRGHGELDIIEAVIKAISPGLKLRDMLEIKSDLILKAKDYSKGRKIHQRLISISQEPKESAQNFLFRAIELKDRLLVASNPDLISKTFLRSVGTGLLSDNIKFQIKPFLDDPAVSDEMLIERVNKAASLEAERINKLKKSTVKSACVNELHQCFP